VPRLAKVRYIKRVPLGAMPYAPASRSIFPLSLASPHIYPTLHRLRQPSANRLQGRPVQGLEPHGLCEHSGCLTPTSATLYFNTTTVNIHRTLERWVEGARSLPQTFTR
jgi:hypothetical protein